MSGTIKIDGEELTISDNGSADIALASFSGYVGFVGEMSEQYGGVPGKTVGLVFAVTGGTITGVFDQNLNPQKEFIDVVGTAAVGYGLGWAGAKTGAIIGGSISGPFAPIGAVVGAILGGVIGGLYGDDFWNNGEKLLNVLIENLDESFEVLDTKIHGTVTQEEFILQSLENDPDFAKRMFPEYMRYRQITTIKNGTSTLADFIKYNSNTKEAEVKSNDDTQTKELVQTVMEETPAEQLTINNVTFDIKKVNNLTVRNAIEEIPAVSMLLSHILIYPGEKIDVGDQGIYTIKSGDTLSVIAEKHGYITKDLLLRNTWLIDEGRVTFEQDKVLIETDANDLANLDHTLTGENDVENILKDFNGGDDTLIGGSKEDVMEGGEGDDTYHVGNGDIINDSDRTGKIVFNGKTLDGLKSKLTEPIEGLFIATLTNAYEDEYFVYEEIGSHLIVTSKADKESKISIQNWDNQTKEALNIKLDTDPKAVEIRISDVSILENNHSNVMVFNIITSRELIDNEEITLNLSIENLTTNLDDYIPLDESVIPLDKDNNTTQVYITIKDDDISEGDEYFNLNATINSLIGLDESDIKIVNGIGTISETTEWITPITTNTIWGNTYDPKWQEDGTPLPRTYYGTGQNDFMNVVFGYGTLYGYEGDDVLYANGGDTLYGGNGNDLLIRPYTVFKDRYVKTPNIFYGGLGNDKLQGTGIFYGGHGNDVLIGEGDNGYLYGEDGNDDIRTATNNNSISGGNGNDTINVYSNNNTISGDLGNDHVYIKGDNNTLYTGDGENRISLVKSGNTVIFGGQDKDTIIIDKDTNDVTAYTSDGDDEITINSSFKEESTNIIYAGSGIDTFISYSKSNTLLYGESGNDIFYVNGSSFHSGGEGDDTFYIETSVYGVNIDGGIGNDEIIFNGYIGYDAFIDLGDGDNNITSSGSTSWFSSKLENSIILGGNGQDTFRNNATSFGDNNEVSTFDGNDYLELKRGHNNKVYSGIGNDFIYLTGLNNEIDTGSGNDVVNLYNINSILENNYIDWSQIEKINDTDSIVYGGYGNDIIYSSHGTVYGENGNDILLGTNGSILSGGSGNDTYHINNHSTYGLTIIDSGDNNKIFINNVDISGVKIRGTEAPHWRYYTDEYGYLYYENNGNIEIIRNIVNANGVTTNSEHIILRNMTFDSTSYGISFNDAPSIDGNPSTEFSLHQDSNINGDLNYIKDFNNDTLSYSATTQNGTFLIDNSGNWTYSPYYDFLGLEEIAVTIDDGKGGTLTEVLTFNVHNEIEGTSSEDKLNGRIKDDKIYGFNGNDILFGDKGNDLLDGGEGADTYFFNRGDGRDTIYIDNLDKIAFGEGNILREDIETKVVDGQLVIGIKEEGKTFEELSDTITLIGDISTTNFTFSDDKSTTLDELLKNTFFIEKGIGKKVINDNEFDVLRLSSLLSKHDLIVKKENENYLLGVKEEGKSFQELEDVLTIHSSIIDKLIHNDGTNIFVHDISFTQDMNFLKEDTQVIGNGSRDVTIEGGISALEGDAVTIDYWYFTHSGGDLVINLFSEYSGDINGDNATNPFDSSIYLFKDSVKNGTLVAFNDDDMINDSHRFDSGMRLSLLEEGQYVLAVSAYYFDENETRTGINIDNGKDESANDKTGGPYQINITSMSDIVIDAKKVGSSLIKEGDGLETIHQGSLDADNEDMGNRFFINQESISLSNSIVEQFSLSLVNPLTGEYKIDGIFDSLAEDQKLIVSFEYEVHHSNPNILSSVKSASLMITGTNDAPSIENIEVSSMEAGSNIVTGQVMANDIDLGVDTNLRYSSNEVSGFILHEDGSYGFNPSDEAYQHLQVGEKETVTVTITVSDEYNASSTTDIVFEILGTNTEPISDNIEGTDSLDALLGTSESDTIYAFDGDDIVFADSGDDIVYGGKGDDLLVGGKGNDVLDGGEGTDIYFFSRGDGQDTVYIDSSDMIVFDEGDILQEEMEVKLIDNHLVLGLREEGKSFEEFNDTLTLIGGSTSTSIMFNDGDNITTISELLKTFFIREGMGEQSIDTNQIEMIRLSTLLSTGDLIIKKEGENYLIGIKEEGKSFDELSNVLNINSSYIDKVFDNNGNSIELETILFNYDLNQSNGFDENAEIINNGTNNLQLNGEITYLDTEMDISIDYWHFSHTGGDISIDVLSENSGDINGDGSVDGFDTHIYLYKDSIIDGTLIDSNDDSDGTDSALEFSSLESGKYILVISAYALYEDEIKTGINLEEGASFGPYQIDITSTNAIHVEGKKRGLNSSLEIREENKFAVIHQGVLPTYDTPGEQSFSLVENSVTVNKSGVIGLNITLLDNLTGEYQIEGDFSILDENEELIVDFEYEVYNSSGLSIIQQASLTIIGSSNGVKITDISSQSVNEDEPLRGIILASSPNPSAQFHYTTEKSIEGFLLNRDGSYSLDSSHEAYQSLTHGEVKELRIPITVSDLEGSSDTQELVIDIIGTNDAPIVQNIEMLSVEENSQIITGQVMAHDVDLGGRANLRYSSNEVTGFMLHRDGSYSFNPSHEAYQYLQVGEKETVTVTVTISDEYNVSSTTNIVFEVVGSNNAPVIDTIVAQTLKEDSGVFRGKITANDLDSDNSLLTYTTNDIVDGFMLNEDGTYSFDSRHNRYQSLNNEELKELRITIDVTDDNGASHSKELLINLIGANDIPLIEPIETRVVKEQRVIRGQVPVNDFDSNALVSYSASEVAGFTLNRDGTYNFNAAHDVYASLIEGAEEHLLIDITVQDEYGATSSETLAITVVGSNRVIEIEEGAELIRGKIVIPDTVRDTSSLIYTSSELSGFILNRDGTYSFDAKDEAYEHLAQRAKVEQSVTIDVFDGNQNLIETKELIFVITGKNDTPVIENNSIRNTIEKNQVLRGRIVANDVDDNAMLHYSTRTRIEGFTLNRDGTYIFDLTDDIYETLENDEGDEIIIPIMISDEFGEVVIQDLIISVTNDSSNENNSPESNGDNSNESSGESENEEETNNTPVVDDSSNENNSPESNGDNSNESSGESENEEETNNTPVVDDSSNENNSPESNGDNSNESSGESENEEETNNTPVVDDSSNENNSPESNGDNSNESSGESENEEETNNTPVVDDSSNENNSPESNGDNSNESSGESENINNKDIFGTIENDKLYADVERSTLYSYEGDDTLYGNINNDKLYASDGEDQLYGSKGNDFLKGGEGSDNYFFSLGDGQDRIKDFSTEGQDIDRVVFDTEVNKSDITFLYKGRDLLIQYSNEDSISIKNQQRGSYGIERVELADGSYLKNEDIDNLIQQINAFATDNGLDIKSNQDLQNNEQLMQMVTNSWHQ